MACLRVVIFAMIFVFAPTKCEADDNISTLGNSVTPKKFGSLKEFYRDDGCRDFSVRFKSDGRCHPLLKQGPCLNKHEWVTVDPYTLQGRCTPRLCGRNRVFVSFTGLCHNIYDKEACRGGRRLYYSPYGKAICDCPLGQFPFPTKDDDCVPLFTRGPCPPYQVVTPSSFSDKLVCAPEVCRANLISTDGFILQMFPHPVDEKDDDGGSCLAMGTSGSWCSPNGVLGYNIFQRRGECIDLKDPTTPYYSSPESNAELDSAYEVEIPCKEKNTCTDNELNLNAESNKIGAEFLGKKNKTVIDDEMMSITVTRIRRQMSKLSKGLANIPLLGACQPGDRTEDNYKCTNPAVYF